MVSCALPAAGRPLRPPPVMASWREQPIGEGPSRAMSAARKNRVMRISERHVAAVTRALPDPGAGVFADRRPAGDEDYDAMVRSLLASAPTDGFWVFAYGSLIWNPAFDFGERRIAVAHGWRRTFCLGWDYRFRGT